MALARCWAAQTEADVAVVLEAARRVWCLVGYLEVVHSQQQRPDQPQRVVLVLSLYDSENDVLVVVGCYQVDP